MSRQALSAFLQMHLTFSATILLHWSMENPFWKPHGFLFSYIQKFCDATWRRKTYIRVKRKKEKWDQHSKWEKPPSSQEKYVARWRNRQCLCGYSCGVAPKQESNAMQWRLLQPPCAPHAIWHSCSCLVCATKPWHSFIFAGFAVCTLSIIQKIDISLELGEWWAAVGNMRWVKKTNCNESKNNSNKQYLSTYHRQCNRNMKFRTFRRFFTNSSYSCLRLFFFCTFLEKRGAEEKKSPHSPVNLTTLNGCVDEPYVTSLAITGIRRDHHVKTYNKFLLNFFYSRSFSLSFSCSSNRSLRISNMLWIYCNLCDLTMRNVCRKNKTYE